MWSPVDEPVSDYLAVTYDHCAHVLGPFYHGTHVSLAVGDELVPGRSSNYEAGRISNHIYFTELVPTAAWGAQLACALSGLAGPGRIYRVVPTGPFEDDPNVTNKRFPGNPTKSYRTRSALTARAATSGSEVNRAMICGAKAINSKPMLPRNTVARRGESPRRRSGATELASR